MKILIDYVIPEQCTEGRQIPLEIETPMGLSHGMSQMNVIQTIALSCVARFGCPMVEQESKPRLLYVLNFYFRTRGSDNTGI